jgi:hypothetical protein
MRQVEITLPSLGLLYPKDSCLYKKEKVMIKEMGANEEDILSSPDLIKSGRFLNEILKSCIVDVDVKNNVDMLFAGDKYALIFGIRVVGLGKEYIIKDFKCPECDKITKEYTFDLSNIESIGICSEEILEPDKVENIFEYQLPVSNEVVKFRLLNSKEDEEIDNQNEKIKKITNTDKDTLSTLRLKNMIISIGMENDKGKLGKVIDTMNIKDIKSLKKHIKKITPDIIVTDMFKCKYCNESLEIADLIIHIDEEQEWKLRKLQIS